MHTFMRSGLTGLVLLATSAAALAMNEQAQRLSQVVSIFKVGDSHAGRASQGLTRAAPQVVASAASLPKAAPAVAAKAQPKAPAPSAKPAAAPKLAAPATPVAPAKSRKVAATAVEDDWESF